jgi:hypothetical protein
MGWGHFGQEIGYSGHMCVLSVNDSLTDRVPTLRDFKTLRGYIVKNETSVAELKSL